MKHILFRNLSLLLCLTVLFSCENMNDETNDSKEKLEGLWTLNSIVSDSAGVQHVLPTVMTKDVEGIRLIGLHFKGDSITFYNSYYQTELDSIISEYKTDKIEYSISEAGYLKMSGVYDCPNCFKLENDVLKYTLTNEDDPNRKIIYSYKK